MTNTGISILLSTYNSELFLKEQIDSILSQTKKEWYLYIRDDGSTDSTVSLIDEYSRITKKVIFLNDHMPNLGAKNSFIKLLSDVESPYYMFCDHDDVWLPSKVEKTFNKMKEAELLHPQKPILIFTDLTVVDSNLNTISSSMWKYQRTNPFDAKDTYSLSISNPVTGCTVMLNHKAKEISLPMSSNSLMHDLWIALNVSHFGYIDFVNEPTILYRQHTDNVIGAKNTNRIYYLLRLKNLMEVVKSNFLMNRMVNSLSFKLSNFKRIILKLKMLLNKFGY